MKNTLPTIDTVDFTVLAAYSHRRKKNASCLFTYSGHNIEIWQSSEFIYEIKRRDFYTHVECDGVEVEKHEYVDKERGRVYGGDDPFGSAIIEANIDRVYDTPLFKWAVKGCLDIHLTTIDAQKNHHRAKLSDEETGGQ